MRGGRFLLIGIFVLVVSVSLVSSVRPFGVENVVVTNSSTAAPDLPTSVLAQAGNVTELNIFGYSITQAWQGYFGNITGTLMLSDASDNVMYNWSLANPEGEIYASRSSSVDWDNIGCFDWDLNGSWLESEFGIESDDVDGVNETFSYFKGHDLFYANNIEISQDSCMSAHIFDSSGSDLNGYYQEVLLWDGVDVVFTSLIEETSVLGFDGRDHDFEMLVLENGHETDLDATPYYFYVELE